jgi:VCBS repeat protein
MPGPTVTTIASFPTSTNNGAEPDGQLFMDSGGDLIGATVAGGSETDPADQIGTTYEITKVAGGFAATPTYLADIPAGLNTLVGVANLSADANGDLFGTEISGGTTKNGAIVEFPAGGGPPSTLASFPGLAGGSQPAGQLLVDASGNLFGITASGGANNDGTLYELQKSGGNYATTPKVLASFGSSTIPFGSTNLVEDAAGDFFGVTASNTVFEVKKTGATYAAPVLLVPANTFPVGTEQLGSLTLDSKGDIFGTTISGGANGDGTVFEIEKTATGYASSPTVIASFSLADGQLLLNHPKDLIVDANGDIFGTTDPSSQNTGGVVFEIVRKANGYESTPTIVANFNGGANGVGLGANLAPDANGNLFGTTQTGTGANADGTAFEITDSGFATTPTITPILADILWQNTSTGGASIWNLDGNTLIGGGPVTPNPGTSWRAVGTADFYNNDGTDILWQNTDGQASIWEMNGTSVIGGGQVGPNPGPDWHVVGTGDFTDNGFSDILWQNTSTGQTSIWEMNGTSVVGGGPISTNPGPDWKAIGTGDFNDDGKSDILWQNTSTGQISVWEMNGNSIMGGGPISTNPGTAWQAIGTGDFYKDGLSDILLQNSNTGQISVWKMSDNDIVGGGPIFNPGTSWHAIGTGAGGADILLQNNSGATSIWEMSGNTIAGGGPVNPNPGTSWRAVTLT